MRLRTAAIAGLVLGALSATLLIAIVQRVDSNSSSDPESGIQAKRGLVEWLAQTPAMSLEARRSVLIERIKAYPDEVEALVTAVGYAGATTQPTAMDVAADLVVLEALQNSLASVSTVDQAGLIVRTSELVQQRGSTKLQNLVEVLTADGKSFTGNPRSALTSEAWASEVDRVLSLQGEGTFKVSGFGALIEGVVADSERMASERLASAQGLLARSRKALGTAGQPVDPASEEFGPTPLGQCSAELLAIQAVVMVLADERFGRWSRVGDPQRAAKLSELEAELAQCGNDLSRTQMVLYNLWAVREINGAEDSAPDQWPIRLGRIDRALLHPSVAAMWSLVHDRRFSEVAKSQERPAIARLFMLTAPVGLERF